MSKHKLITNSVTDLASSFLYYDRKEDDELPVGEIEKVIRSGEMSIDDIVGVFKTELQKAVESGGE